MGFFSELKEDLSQAVNELKPQEQEQQKPEAGTAGEAEQSVGSASEVSLEEMLKNIDEFKLPEDMTVAGESADAAAPGQEAALEETAEAESYTAEPGADAAANWMNEAAAAAEEVRTAENTEQEPEEPPVAETAGEPQAEQPPVDTDLSWMESIADQAQEAAAEEEQEPELVAEQVTSSAESWEEPAGVSEEKDVMEESQIEESKGAEKTMEMGNRVALDETSVITTGMVVTGDLSTEGSLDVAGTVNGNIDALGKLNITGHVNGNSKAAEIYAENAKINGEIISEGAVKIESSTVIIGNITASSAAIAGAVKGDIDVKGPVVLDASAIVMGNIKSKSVQINNGAVIEGMCSQCYADVSPTTFFDDYKPDIQTKSKSK